MIRDVVCWRCFDVVLRGCAPRVTVTVAGPSATLLSVRSYSLAKTANGSHNDYCFTIAVTYLLPPLISAISQPHTVCRKYRIAPQNTNHGRDPH